jgi:hypothetical protein
MASAMAPQTARPWSRLPAWLKRAIRGPGDGQQRGQQRGAEEETDDGPGGGHQQKGLAGGTRAIGKGGDLGHGAGPQQA